MFKNVLKIFSIDDSVTSMYVQNIEKHPISDARFDIVMHRISYIVAVITAAILVITSTFGKLAILLFFAFCVYIIKKIWED